MAEQKKYRNFGGVIYKDSESYNWEDVLRNGHNYFVEFAWIEHDKDVDEDGVLKKPHIHWLGRKKNGTTISYVSDIMELQTYEVEIIKNWKGAVRYLTHVDYEDKYQYDISEINGSIIELPSYFEMMGEGDAVLKMLEQRESGMSYKKILIDAVQGGYYASFRRNIGVIEMVMNDQRAIYEREISEMRKNVRSDIDN